MVNLHKQVHNYELYDCPSRHLNRKYFRDKISISFCFLSSQKNKEKEDLLLWLLIKNQKFYLKCTIIFKLIDP